MLHEKIPSTNEIVDKIYKRLELSGWAEQLRFFLYSEDFYSIIDQLKLLKKQGKVFVPKLSVMFRWLELCPVEELKVVIFTDMKSNTLTSHRGLSFHQEQYEGKKNRSAVGLTRLLFNTVRWSGAPPPGDMVKWAEQGVLLFPLASTARLHGSQMIKTWEPFTQFMIEKLQEIDPLMPWVFYEWGTYRYLSSVHSPLVYKLEKKYEKGKHLRFTTGDDTEHLNRNNLWKTINRHLLECGKDTVKW